MKKITHCPICGHHLNPSVDELTSYCPICDTDVIVHTNIACPECDTEIECMCVVGADESLSGKTERLYNCSECGSAWSITEGEEIKRYFFG